MEDAFAVDELDSAEDLPEEVSALGLCQLVILAGNALEEFAALEVFREDDGLLFAFEVVLEGDGSLVRKKSVFSLFESYKLQRIKKVVSMYVSSTSVNIGLIQQVRS